MRVGPTGDRAVPPGAAGFPYGPVAAGGAAGLGGLAYLNQRGQLANSPLGGDVQNALSPYGFGLGTTGPTATMQEMYPVESARGQRQLPPMEVRGKAKVAGKQAQGKKGAGQKNVPLPPRRPAEAQPEMGWEPNLNYLVTSALDRLTGMGRAEEGRRYQQAVEDYERQYGPIRYGF